MADRSLRGTRLGAFSMETDVGVVPSERQLTTYGGGEAPEPKPVRPVRTHWDMLLERRSIPELEELLEERLTLLRQSRGEKPRRRSA